jgi:hypothetical protein
MPRISDRKVVAVFLAATLAILTSCASPKPPATAHVQGSPADPCRKYERPTEFGRCRLFMSADGWQFISEIGRNAALDTQIRCAPVQPDLDVYAECIRGARVVATMVPAAPAAGPVSQAPIRVEPITPDVAVARPSPEPRTWIVAPEAEARLAPRDQTLSIEPRRPSAESARERMARPRPAREEQRSAAEQNQSLATGGGQREAEEQSPAAGEEQSRAAVEEQSPAVEQQSPAAGEEQSPAAEQGRSPPTREEQTLAAIEEQRPAAEENQRPAAGEQRSLAVKASAEPGADAMVFRIELSRPAEQTVVLIYGTVEGTAKAGKDFEPQQGMVTIAPGTKGAEVRVPLIEQSVAQGEKRFELFLAADPKVAEVVDRRVIATITGDD